MYINVKFDVYSMMFFLLKYGFLVIKEIIKVNINYVRFIVFLKFFF